MEQTIQARVVSSKNFCEFAHQLKASETDFSFGQMIIFDLFAIKQSKTIF
jgi:hypothetical protein